MTLSADQEMAFKLTELYLKHIMSSRDRKDLSIEDVIDKYNYVLDEIKSKFSYNLGKYVSPSISLLIRVK